MPNASTLRYIFAGRLRKCGENVKKREAYELYRSLPEQKNLLLIFHIVTVLVT